MAESSEYVDLNKGDHLSNDEILILDQVLGESKGTSQKSSDKGKQKESIEPKKSMSNFDESNLDSNNDSDGKSKSEYKVKSSNEENPESKHNEPENHESEGNRWWTYVEILILAFVITIFFLILCYPMTDVMMTSYVPDSTYRWLLRGLIFFILLIIALVVAFAILC
jgi:cation transport ATPase